MLAIIKSMTAIGGKIMRNIIFIFVMILQLLYCNKDKNPVNPIPNTGGAGNLILMTQKTNYSWKQSESNFIIIIEGTLKNKSSDTYYSHIGDGFGPAEQDRIIFAANSAGRIEKYDELDKKWKEINILGLLIEGSKAIPIKSSTNYAIHAHLSRKIDQVEHGKYKLRIEYHDNPELRNTEMIYRDYSNIFEIK